MEIVKYFGVDGARAAQGSVVIIDIFRAATTAAYALSRGADYVIPVAHSEEAFALKEQHPEYLLMGEHRGIKIDGFDFGNSPFELSTVDLTHKVLVQRTSNGTQGLVNAQLADEVIFGSFATVSAIVHHLKSSQTPRVSIVSMDDEGSEDDKFADYLAASLRGEYPAIEPIIQYLRQHKASQRFLDPHTPHFNEEDFHLCLAVDTFTFFVLVEFRSAGMALVKA